MLIEGIHPMIKRMTKIWHF